MNSLQPGIYLGLPEEVYFNDPAVSYSDCRALLVSGLEYWLGSVHNPHRAEKKRTDPMAIGKQYHTLLLDGEDTFHERYMIMPGDAWVQGKEVVQRSRYKEMLDARTVLQKMAHADKILNRKYGYPEVTVVWRDEDSGIMCRARQDFFCWEWSVDYKTCAATDGDFLKHSFRKYKYEMQQVHYTEGRSSIRRALHAGAAHFFGDFSPEFVKQFEAAEHDGFTFVFQKKDTPHSARLMCLNDASIYRGQDFRRRAFKVYQDNLAKYGLNQPWSAGNGGIEEFDTHYGFSDGE